MLPALEEAAAERAEAEAWTVTNGQHAATQELLHRIYHTLHVAFMQEPHPDPDWEAFRPEHIRSMMTKTKDKPLTGRQFLAHILGRR